MEHLNLEYGRDRIVIVEKDKNRVIKIARNENGLIQNFNEFRFNKKRPDVTAKVIEYHGEILVMEYVEPIPNPIDKSTGTITDRLWQAVHSILEDELGEAVSDNEQIGRTKDERIVSYDYGHTREFVFATKFDGYEQKEKLMRTNRKGK